MSDLVRNVVKLVLCLLVAGALLLANIFVFLSDWTGLAAGLDLMGYEGQTVRRMPIVGALLGALLGEATYSYFAGGAMAMVRWLGFFLASVLLLDMLRALRDGLIGRIRGREPAAQRTLAVLGLVDALNLAVVGAVLAPVCWMELQIWRLRTLQGAQQIALEDVGVLIPWKDLAQQPDTWIVEFMGLGGWGYLCVGAAAALLLELSFSSTGEAWSRVTNSASALWTSLAGSPVSAPRPAAAVATKPAPVPAQPVRQPPARRVSAPVPSAVKATAPAEPSTAVRREVIGSPAGTTVTLEEARSDPSKYHVDEDGTVWLRSYYRTVFDA